MAPEELLAIYKRYGIDEGEQPQAADPQRASSAQASAAVAPRAPKTDTAVVWKLHADNTMEPLKVSLGITDHAYTQLRVVLKGDLQEGDELVIRSVAAKSQGFGVLRR